MCDRYADSTLAYQGYGHQTDWKALTQIVEFATGGLKPDLTVLMDVANRDRSQAAFIGWEHWNRLDAKEVAFHQRVRDGYHQMAAAEPDRWVTVDAGQGLEGVCEDLIKVVLTAFEIGGL